MLIASRTKAKENNNEERMKEKKVKGNEGLSRGIHRPAVIGSRARSLLSDKDLLFKSNVLRKLLIPRDRRMAKSFSRCQSFLLKEPYTPHFSLSLLPRVVVDLMKANRDECKNGIVTRKAEGEFAH